MRTIAIAVSVALAGVVLLPFAGRGADASPGWNLRFDVGGNIPEDPELTEFGGDPGDLRLELGPGFQFDLSAGYRITPWLEVGPELGFTINFVDWEGQGAYPGDTSLSQILMMANLRLEYPFNFPLRPFAGVGIGGTASFLTFGGGGSYYYYYEPDGTGADITLAGQAFAGLRYNFNDKGSVGVIYRFLFTDRQHWDVDWWTGRDFEVSIDSLRMHSICLEFMGQF